MRLVKTGLLAAVLAVGFGAAAFAQSVEIRTRTTSGHSLHDDGVRTTRVVRERRVVREPSTTSSVKVRRGASYYAPGQVKKRVSVRSARDYAPGHRMHDDDRSTTTVVRRRVRTID
ncbi:hypothetical protein [Microvirga guangxiensis]|uniref:DUF4148 domain-containing protein n=1 Tax=Microvirga guangxiensis TaxID=549386 RepID=A0A1G5IQ32_9HYPH|nr:hypothetical protein [Microvirga guangxiensis]SCY78235.1 hypothetical protein SAMN02927923_02255 [Microvirga guangxiensis]